MDLVTTQLFNLPPELRDPQSILWHMALVAREDKASSFLLLQESLNHLSQKAANNAVFTDDEKTFLTVVYTCPWWGGKNHGLNETTQLRNPLGTSHVDSGLGNGHSRDLPLTNIADGAQLVLASMAQHYVLGEGRCYPVNVATYRNSSIVSDTLQALKDYICELSAYHRPTALIASTDRGFLQSKHAQKVEAKRKNTEVKGFIFNDGTLMLDQKDPRLINLGNRFRITAMTSPLGAHLMTRWRIEGTYRFENFMQGAAETGLPLSERYVLTIPSCLGVHLVALNIARPFDYFADWVERYPLVKM